MGQIRLVRRLSCTLYTHHFGTVAMAPVHYISLHQFSRRRFD